MHNTDKNNTFYETLGLNLLFVFAEFNDKQLSTQNIKSIFHEKHLSIVQLYTESSGLKEVYSNNNNNLYFRTNSKGLKIYILKIITYANIN